MPIGAILGIGSALIGASSARKAAKAQTGAATRSAEVQSDSALEAARIQAASADRATDAQREAANKDLAMRQGVYDDTTAKFQPYLESGNNALAAYNFELGMGDRPDGYGGYTKTPGYDFALRQGMDSVESRGAASGGVNSGSTLKALAEHNQDYATGQYGNYLNRLGGLMSSGRAAAGLQAAAGQNYATGASNAYGNIGNAEAGGAMAYGNAFGNAYNTRGNAYGNAYTAIGNAQSAGTIGVNNAIQGGVQNALSLYQYQKGIAPQHSSPIPPPNPWY